MADDQSPKSIPRVNVAMTKFQGPGWQKAVFMAHIAPPVPGNQGQVPLQRPCWPYPAQGL
jgi:hypothetical protein